MQIIGVDFTSAPGPAKPLTLARCRFENGALLCTGVERLTDFAGFEAALAAPGPWIMGADFPFALADGLPGALGWPTAWPAFADHLAGLGRAGFEGALTAHRRAAPEGQKHLPRAVDKRAGGAAPNNIVNPPVGKMLFEGVTRLRAAGVAVPGLSAGDPARRVVEAYPAVAVAGLIGKAPYKDGAPAEAAARLARRRALLAALAGDAGRARFGFATHAPEDLANDPRGDDLDALLCAVQAGWAHLCGLASAAPTGPEGWIADPGAFTPPRPPAPPPDAAARRAAPPVLCYPPETLPGPDLPRLAAARQSARKTGAVTVPPRDARCFRVPAGAFFRISCPEGPQVGDLNLWNGQNLDERFYSGKTRALHGTHVSTGDRLWSCFPFLRPMATITADTLGWYGIDTDGAGVHDVIGTRCDPYTHALLSDGGEYHYCCHSNLLRALAQETGLTPQMAEPHVHDVLNVFMCTGFERETGRYIMKASPVRRGDYIEFFAEIEILGALSACPGGDCGAEHSSDAVPCHPLLIEIFAPDPQALKGISPPRVNSYGRSHGL